MACIFVAEVKVHSDPPVRKTFIAYADSKGELTEMLEARRPWHELVAAKPIDTETNVHELTLELLEYGLRKTFEEKIAAEAYNNTLPYSKVPEVRDAYDRRECELYTLFVTDFKRWLVQQGVTNTKQVDKIVSKCWDEGHSSGYGEVVNCAHKYIELVKL